MTLVLLKQQGLPTPESGEANPTAGSGCSDATPCQVSHKQRLNDSLHATLKPTTRSHGDLSTNRLDSTR